MATGTAATAAKDCLELTCHAEAAGADIVYLQTPMMETPQRRVFTESRPPQAVLPVSAKVQFREACRRFGLVEG